VHLTTFIFGGWGFLAPASGHRHFAFSSFCFACIFSSN